jgi:hypothetical protein
LDQGVRRMLGPLADEFFDHPLIASLSRPGKRPSYVPANLLLSRSFLLYGQLATGKDEKVRVSVERVWMYNRALIMRAVKQVYAAQWSKQIKQLVDKIHSDRPPMIPELPESFFLPAIPRKRCCSELRVESCQSAGCFRCQPVAS